MDCLAYDTLVELEAFPEVTPPPLRGVLWILGKKYCLPRDKGDMTDDIRSRLWCSYRKNFRAISGTTYTTDTGWGCTLRCGQMLLGHTLICNHLGRDWRWQPPEREAKYWKILSKFLDTRASDYSIQLIALQGADFGRPVGQWFGPNNISQAIKKLSVHDSWSELAVHVAMDMVVVIEDMKSLCRRPHEISGGVRVTTESGETLEVEPPSYGRSQSANLEGMMHHTIPLPVGSRPYRSKTDPSTAPSLEHAVGQSHEDAHVQAAATRKRKSKLFKAKSEETPSTAGAKTTSDDGDKSQLSTPVRPTSSKLIESGDFMKVSMNEFHQMESSELHSLREEGDYLAKAEGSDGGFRPLLLLIPLRLGQDKFNSEYTEALKACLTLPQSVGIIGGRPRHALYIIGYHNDNLLYLDPHTTQQTIHPHGPTPDHNSFPDSSYHCSQADQMPINELDPSLAIGFFCKNEEDIDDLCERLRKDVLCKMKYMFEVTQTRPVYWQPVEMASVTSTREPFVLVGEDFECRDSDSDNGFELIDWPPPGLPPDPGLQF